MGTCLFGCEETLNVFRVLSEFVFPMGEKKGDCSRQPSEGGRPFCTCAELAFGLWDGKYDFSVAHAALSLIIKLNIVHGGEYLIEVD